MAVWERAEKEIVVSRLSSRETGALRIAREKASVTNGYIRRREEVEIYVVAEAKWKFLSLRFFKETGVVDTEFLDFVAHHAGSDAELGGSGGDSDGNFAANRRVTLKVIGPSEKLRP